MVFKLIRSVLGIDRSDSADRGDGTDVPVDSGSTDTATVDATDADGAAEPADATGETTTGTDTESLDTDTDSDTDTPESSAAAGTDASASTGSLTEEPPEADAAAEPAEAAGPTDDSEDTPVEADDPEGADDTPVEDINGIGPAYAQRLRDAGIDTVGDLLAADPADVAESTDLSPKRIGRWQDAAESA